MVIFQPAMLVYWRANQCTCRRSRLPQAQMQRAQLIAILLSPTEDSDAMLQLDVHLGFFECRTIGSMYGIWYVYLDEWLIFYG